MILVIKLFLIESLKKFSFFTDNSTIYCKDSKKVVFIAKSSKITISSSIILNIFIEVSSL